MNIQELLLEAATLMGIGMLVVFLFLTILIFAVKLLAVVGEKFADPIDNSPAPRSPSGSRVKSGQIPHAVVAAIGAAIHQHRNQAK